MPFQRFLHLVVEEAVKEGEKDSLTTRLFSVMEENARSEIFSTKVLKGKPSICSCVSCGIIITDFVVKSK